MLAVRAFGLDFPNPIGLAAGFDKNAEVPGAMLRMGFGFVEAGTITPRPQSGNPRPRIFRLSEDLGVINRLGFNNGGIEAARENLKQFDARSGLLGLNIGANKTSEDRIADYAAGFEALAVYASYITINISSPNTPNLRDLQHRDELAKLIGSVDDVRKRVKPQCPLLVKIAPDLTEEDQDDIAAVTGSGVIDGLIVSNTTISRPGGLRSTKSHEQGGLSGKPLFDLSTNVLASMYRKVGNKLPIIGVGGVASGADAYKKIRHGATLVQLYSALTYRGPALVTEIKRDLADLLRADGFASVADAIGVDVK